MVRNSVAMNMERELLGRRGRGRETWSEWAIIVNEKSLTNPTRVRQKGKEKKNRNKAGSYTLVKHGSERTCLIAGNFIRQSGKD